MTHNDVNEICSNCKTGDHVVFDSTSAERICTGCGMVIKERMVSTAPDVTNPNASISSFQEGINPYETTGTSIPKNTFLTKYTEDGKEKKVDISKIHARMSYTSKQKSYDCVAKDVIENLLTAGKITERVSTLSKRLWVEIMENSSHRGSVRRGVIASCILYASHNCGSSLTRKEVTDMLKIRKKDLTRGEHAFEELIRDSKHRDVLHKSTSVTANFEKALNMFGREDIKFKHAKKCIRVYNDNKLWFERMSAITSLAVVINHVLQKELKDPPDLNEVSDATRCSKTTIRKRSIEFNRKLVES